jgi:hypothetical protein
MRLMEHAHNHWAINVPHGTTVEDIKKEEFWSLVCDKFARPGAFVTIDADDLSWFAQGRVMSAGKTWAQIHIYNVVELGTADIHQTSKAFKTEWKGQELLWCVVRLSDGAVIQDKLDNARSAASWLTEHERKIG